MKQVHPPVIKNLIPDHKLDWELEHLNKKHRDIYPLEIELIRLVTRIMWFFLVNVFFLSPFPSLSRKFHYW